jgi:hypothetical protein
MASFGLSGMLEFVFYSGCPKQFAIDISITYAGLALLISVVGNYMGSLKPNYLAGIPLPCTSNDPENWRQTHRTYCN